MHWLSNLVNLYYKQIINFNIMVKTVTLPLFEILLWREFGLNIYVHLLINFSNF